MVGRNSMTVIAARAVLVLLCLVESAAARDDIVLIVSARSPIVQLDSTQMRRLFLGMTVVLGGNRMRPLLNTSSPKLREIFLQNIVAMSESTYDRYVLRMSLQQGRVPPTVVKSSDQLMSMVASDLLAVSFASQSDVAHDSRIRVLRMVWHD